MLLTVTDKRRQPATPRFPLATRRPSHVPERERPSALAAARPIVSDRDQRPAAAVFQALGNDKRLAILRVLLLGSEPIPLRDIQVASRVSSGQLWHHVQVLQTAGLIQVTEHGLHACWEVVPGALDRVRSLLDVS